MREMCGRGGCLLYAEINGVLKPESSTNSGAHVISHHRLNQVISMTCCSFDASTKIHSRSPVLPSPDPVCPPGSGFPLDFSGGFAHIRYRLRTRRMATGPNTIPGPYFGPLLSCDLVSHWTSSV